jgi:putative ABC transport system substrate-binding protein
MNRRDVITLLGGAAAWPLAAGAQQTALPVVGGISGSTQDSGARTLAAFRQGLGQTGFIEGQNVLVE